MSTNNVQFRDWLEKRLTDSEFRDEWEASEPAYQVTRLRIKRGLTQKQLAKLVGTHQSSIARLESGKSEPRLSFLRRVAKALRGRLEIQIVSQEEAPMPRQQSIITTTQLDKTEPIYVENWPSPKGDGIGIASVSDASNTTISEVLS